MKIVNNIEITDLALYLKKENMLIIADSHIGFEEALNKQGVLVPRIHFKELIKRLEKIINGKRFEKIIINGDIKHEFGKISETEWRHTLRLLDFLGRYCDEIILIKGNHDNIIGPVAEKRKVRVKDYYKIGNILIIHGNKIPDKAVLKQVKTIIIGHEHPAIMLRQGLRSEKYKCFLKGKYKHKVLIVQPSLNLLTEGTGIDKEKLLSPFLQQ
ncbi:MAG: metallophosphoesterase, partial [Nanoarchaeota archaeon]|nr:metallophosphoesterase [Nanoarchaeota archaeon]